MRSPRTEGGIPLDAPEGCEACGHRGFTIADGEMHVCACVVRKRLHSLYESVGIPRNLFGAKLENYIPKEGKDRGIINQRERVKEHMISYLCQMEEVLLRDGDFHFGGGPNGTKQWDGRTMVLCGNDSVGKSLFAVIIAKRAIELGVAPRIFQWAHIVQACYDFATEDNELNEIIGKFKRYRPIIIENLSTTYETRQSPTDNGSTGGLNPVTLRKLDSLFSSVHQKGLPVVFTTPHGVVELDNQGVYGPLLSAIISAAGKMRLPTAVVDDEHNTIV